MTTTDAVKVPQPRPAGPKVKALEQTVLASPTKLVRVIGTSNLATLSGVQTVDSVALKLGDVVLLTNQTTTHQNRLWTVMQGTWIAPLIADHPEKLPAGTKVTAQEGTSNAGKTFRLTTTGTIVLGTTALSWTQDGGSSGSGDVVGPSSATDGSLARFDGTTGKLLKDGVAPDASTLEISGSTLRQKDAGTTNAKLANMATKTYKGRTSGTTGVPEDVSAANLATDLASQTAFSGTYETITNVGLKAPKASPTFTGTVTIPNGASATEAAALGQTVTKTGGGVETISTATATGATTVNLTNGNVHKLTLTGAVTLTFSGATNGSGCSMTLYIAQDATGGRTITWPTVKWAGGVAPVISTAANAIDIYTFFTMDGGTTWFGNQAGKGYA